MGLFFPVTAAIMVAGTLFTYPDNFRAQKALIAAKYSGAQLTVAKDFVFGETNKTPDFLKKFPLGKVPAFEGSDGVLLTESNAIAYYVANDELRGGSEASARAQVVQWMCMADNEILPASCTWVFPTMGIMQFNKNATDPCRYRCCLHPPQPLQACSGPSLQETIPCLRRSSGTSMESLNHPKKLASSLLAKLVEE